MILLADVGNSRVKWLSCAQGEFSQRGQASRDGADWRELGSRMWADLPHPARVIIVSVAGPEARAGLAEWVQQHWGIVAEFVTSTVAAWGIHNSYAEPERMGADRWVAMIGARHRMLQGCTDGAGPRPLVVVMVGTAVTVEAVDAEGQFLGGLILPGHGIMLRALESGTAGLHVPTGHVTEFPTNTSDALTSGGTFASAGAVQRMVRHVAERCGQPPLCVMTGGAGWKMAPYMETPFELVEGLIFEGLLAMAAANDPLASQQRVTAL